MKWESYVRSSLKCDLCQGQNLLDAAAHPLFMEAAPNSTDILFIWEAPNKDDTCNPDKQHITVNPDTDPSGTFFHELFVEELGLEVSRHLFVTNSVLCLPRAKGNNNPVTATQMHCCSERLRSLIDLFAPRIVCPLGAKALRATALIEDHGFRRMGDAVNAERPYVWYDRLLFPLYHTSSRARNPFNGRPEERQRADWKQLRRLYDALDLKENPLGNQRMIL
ncbi:MAG: hypothetical protein A2X80_12765 [Geobacteraceae bacterium GWB2_52_12]|nr:MAG: hypothetical protein A2X80_12765 [Geobacteraceae bacterium GWB2_52_12]